MPRITSALQARNAQYRAATGLSYRGFCALLAVVSAYELDGYPVWSGIVTKLVAGVEGDESLAGEELMLLMRQGLVQLHCDGRVEGAIMYVPTGRAFTRIDEWTGRGKRAAAE